jgi:hypothetical protein
VLAPYAQSLILRPGGEVYYKFRLVPASKSKGAHISRAVKSAYERKDLAYMPLSEAVASLLGSKSKFHPEPKSHSKEGKNGFGIMGERCPNFTKNAKNTIRWGASAIEEEFGIDRCVFLTGTLPGSTLQAQLTFAANSSYFIDRINKWLLKHFPISGEVFRISVWELQKRGALHLHAIVAVLPGQAQRLIDEFQELWIHLLESLSDSTGVDLFGRAGGGSHRGNYLKPIKKQGRKGTVKDVMCFGDVVKKSVAAYLSKYLSKSAGDFRYSAKPAFYPARWWSVSRAVQNLIASQTISVALPRFHDHQLTQVHELVETAFAPHKSGKSEANLPTFSEDGEFIGFKQTHVGYMCWADTETAKEVLLSLGEYLNCYLAEDDIKYSNDLRTYIVTGLAAGKKKYEEILYEMGWDAATRNASKVEQSIALHELRTFMESEQSILSYPT